jgi:hypothetical protein
MAQHSRLRPELLQKRRLSLQNEPLVTARLLGYRDLSLSLAQCSLLRSNGLLPGLLRPPLQVRQFGFQSRDTFRRTALLLPDLLMLALGFGQSDGKLAPRALGRQETNTGTLCSSSAQ